MSKSDHDVDNDDVEKVKFMFKCKLCIYEFTKKPWDKHVNPEHRKENLCGEQWWIKENN